MGGRRDSAAQISGTSPPSTSPPPGAQRRRRSSLAQLTDILREWSGGSSKRNTKPPLNRRETLADLARSLPWAKATSDCSGQYTATPQIHAPSMRKRRESSADSGIRSMRSRRDSHASELAKLWSAKRENSGEKERDRDRDRERDRDRDRERDRDRGRDRDRDREGDENVPPNDNARNVSNFNYLCLKYS